MFDESNDNVYLSNPSSEQRLIWHSFLCLETLSSFRHLTLKYLITRPQTDKCGLSTFQFLHQINFCSIR